LCVNHHYSVVVTIISLTIVNTPLPYRVVVVSLKMFHYYVEIELITASVYTVLYIRQ